MLDMFKCCVCGKEVTLIGEESGFSQVRYRTLEKKQAWESGWRTLCKECASILPIWLLEGNGQNDILEGDDLK